MATRVLKKPIEENQLTEVDCLRFLTEAQITPIIQVPVGGYLQARVDAPCYDRSPQYLQGGERQSYQYYDFKKFASNVNIMLR